MSPNLKTHRPTGPRVVWRQQELTYSVQPDATIAKDGSDLSHGAEPSVRGAGHDRPSEAPECPGDRT